MAAELRDSGAFGAVEVRALERELRSEPRAVVVGEVTASEAAVTTFRAGGPEFRSFTLRDASGTAPIWYLQNAAPSVQIAPPEIGSKVVVVVHVLDEPDPDTQQRPPGSSRRR